MHILLVMYYKMIWDWVFNDGEGSELI